VWGWGTTGGGGGGHGGGGGVCVIGGELAALAYIFLLGGGGEVGWGRLSHVPPRPAAALPPQPPQGRARPASAAAAAPERRHPAAPPPRPRPPPGRGRPGGVSLPRGGIAIRRAIDPRRRSPHIAAQSGRNGRIGPAGRPCVQTQVCAACRHCRLTSQGTPCGVSGGRKLTSVDYHAGLDIPGRSRPHP
jgi:hypothetical protein